MSLLVSAPAFASSSVAIATDSSAANGTEPSTSFEPEMDFAASAAGRYFGIAVFS